MNKQLMVLVSIVIMLSGCATSTRIDQAPTAEQGKEIYPLTRNVRVDDVAGGGRAGRMQIAIIDSKDYKQALKDSLAASDLLANDASGKYILRAAILEVGQPPSGVDITVTSVVQYTLVQASNGRELLSERITAPFTSTLNDTHPVVERVESAVAGSAASNIAQLTRKLNEMPINKDELALPK